MSLTFMILCISLGPHFSFNIVFLRLFIFYFLHAALDIFKDTENIKLVFCAVKDTIMQAALKEFNLA